MFLFAMWGVYRTIKDTRKFYREAERIESMIKNNEDFYQIMNDFYEMIPLAYHKNTARRAREIIDLIKEKYKEEYFSNF